jgi:hypothetical protein
VSRHGSAFCDFIAVPRMGRAENRRTSRRVTATGSGLINAIGQGVSNGKAHRHCEFSPRGTFLSLVEPGILRKSSTRDEGSAAHSDDLSDAKDFSSMPSRIENLSAAARRGAVAGFPRRVDPLVFHFRELPQCPNRATQLERRERSSRVHLVPDCTPATGLFVPRTLADSFRPRVPFFADALS